MRSIRFTLIGLIIITLALPGCGALRDYLGDYTGSLWSPTVGDMIYLESAGDSYMFGKVHEPLYIFYRTLAASYFKKTAADVSYHLVQKAVAFEL